MSPKQAAYPIPVLGNGDDVDALFDCGLEFSVTANEVRVRGRFSSDHGELLQMLDAGTARYALLTESRRTFYRQYWTNLNREFEIAIPGGKLRELLEITPYVIATDSIPKYSPSKLSEDYGTFKSFPVRAGEVLAKAPTTQVLLETEFAGSQKDRRSILRVEMDPEQKENQIVPYLDSDQIIIRLSKPMMELYQRIKTTPDLVHGVIALPALAEAIRRLSHSDYQEYRWHIVLSALIEQNDLDADMPLEAAQVLFGWPAYRALNAIALEDADTEDREA